ncbi:MAG: aspartate semialdehyde dehydrogenase [Monoraphidium minutum]|nr:MAG: aspartate semialdehyde dehydrogenase [Monoraphidium minutum]
MQLAQRQLRASAGARASRARAVVVRAAKTAKGPRIAIVGVTGAVGQEFLTVLHERNFPYSSIKLLASARSAGKKQEFEGETYTIEELTENSFGDVDIALFSAGGSISKKLGPVAAKAGAVVVDNSSAFRMTEGVPLVIPEVNPEAMAAIKIGGGGAIIANPNCSTIIALMAVTPLHKVAKVKRMIVSTYQAASGAGAAAMEELRSQTRDVLDGKPAKPEIFPHQYAFNLFSHNSSMDASIGYNEEEIKLVKETKKIWGTDDVKITATCVRVPVMRAHAESINLEFASDISEAQARPRRR